MSDPAILNTIVSVVASGLLAGVTWILRTLSKQNATMNQQTQALAVLVARVGPAIDNVDKTAKIETRVTRIEAHLNIPSA